MSSVLSPPSLQQLCQAVTASWLLDWSGMVGQVSVRTAALQTLRNQTGQRTSSLLSEPLRADRIISYCQNNSCSINQLDSAKTVRLRSSRCRKKSRKECDAPISIGYKTNLSTLGFCDKTVMLEYLEHCNYEYDNVCSGEKYSSSLSLYNKELSFDEGILEENVRICSLFFKNHLPPILVNQIVSLAWKTLSRLVSVTRQNQSKPYQVADWVRRATVLLWLCTSVSAKNFELNISGIPDSLIEDILQIIGQYFPQRTLSSFVLPRSDFKKKQLKLSDKCKTVFRDILLRFSLTSLTLNNELCDDTVLSILSHLTLKEIAIGGNSVSEKGIVNGLCALNVSTVDDAKNIIISGQLQSISKTPLRKSLQKLEMSFQHLHSSVYHIIPAIFSELQYYNPHRNVVQCLQNFGRFMLTENIKSTSMSSPVTTNLLRINVGHSNRVILNQIASICPKLQELVLTVDSNAQDTFEALENFQHLSHIEILYFPSLPASQPKLDAMILQTVISVFQSQLRVICLTGFNVPGSVLMELSQLQELYQLSFTDCWLSRPRILPHNPFPSLGKLSLNFLPDNMTMQFLTMGGKVNTLHLDLKQLEWGSNPLTDSSIKSLVSSGILQSLHTFTATSSYLTKKALGLLASMPYMKVVGYLAAWGLTEEELCCVNHSGLQHILCYL